MRRVLVTMTAFWVLAGACHAEGTTKLCDGWVGADGPTEYAQMAKGPGPVHQVAR